MTMTGQWDEEDMVPKPTEAQRDYADSLLERLEEAGCQDADNYEHEVETCQDIGEMSDLIDSMKAELEDYE